MLQVIRQQLALHFIEVDGELAYLVGGDNHSAEPKYGARFVSRMIPRNVLAYVPEFVEIRDVMHTE
jgi:hypothetical protein